jgi:hypothetical protein
MDTIFGGVVERMLDGREAERSAHLTSAEAALSTFCVVAFGLSSGYIHSHADEFPALPPHVAR